MIKKKNVEFPSDSLFHYPYLQKVVSEMGRRFLQILRSFTIDFRKYFFLIIYYVDEFSGILDIKTIKNINVRFANMRNGNIIYVHITVQYERI